MDLIAVADADDPDAAAPSAGPADVAAHLFQLLDAREQVAARLLGASVLHEIESRHAPPLQAAENSLHAHVHVAPPDPGATIALADGRHVALGELWLPAAGTVEAARFASAVHACCCEASARLCQWGELERHACAALEGLRGLCSAGPSGWMRWAELWHTHAGLVGARLAAEAASGATGVAAATVAAAKQASSRLRRQLRGYCERRGEAPGAAGVLARLARAGAVLRLAIGVVGSDADDRADSLWSLSAALRYVRAELGRAASPSQPEAEAAAAAAAALGGTQAEAHGGTQAEIVARLVEELLRHPALLGPATEHDDDEPAAHAHKRARGSTEPPAASAAACRAAAARVRAALLYTAQLAALIALPDDRSCAPDEAMRLSALALAAADVPPAHLGPCEPRPMLGELADYWAGGDDAAGAPPHQDGASRGADAALELRRALAAGSHTRALCLFHEASSLGVGEASALGSEVAEAAPARREQQAAESLQCAQRSAAHGAALYAAHAAEIAEGLAAEGGATLSEQWDGPFGGGAGGAGARAAEAEAEAEASMCRRTNSLLLLLTGRAEDALAALDGRRRPPAANAARITQSLGKKHAAALGVLRACCGDHDGALDALQRALARDSAGGRSPALPLYAILRHYDAKRQREPALRMTDFLALADFDAPAWADATARPRVLLALQPTLFAAAAAGGGGPSQDSRPPPLALHDAGTALSPLAASYLRGRASLLCGRWEESARLLRALLDEGRDRRQAALAAYGVDEPLLLTQLALAMLHAGEAAELLELLKVRGALAWPAIAPLVADALTCDDRPLEALETLAASASAASAGAATPADACVARAELRARNNRACLLACTGSLAEAEAELERAAQLAPAEVPPAYNLALLRWRLGEKRRAAEAWLRFRGWPLAATPDVYRARAASVLPARDAGGPPQPESHVSGRVDAASLASLDRSALLYWAALRTEAAVQRHWGGALGDEGQQ